MLDDYVESWRFDFPLLSLTQKEGRTTGEEQKMNDEQIKRKKIEKRKGRKN